jgi:hypothetical protein
MYSLSLSNVSICRVPTTIDVYYLVTGGGDVGTAIQKTDGYLTCPATIPFLTAVGSLVWILLCNIVNTQPLGAVEP